MDVKALSAAIDAHTRAHLAQLALLPGVSGEDIEREVIIAFNGIFSKAAAKADREAERQAAKAEREAAKAAAKAEREAAKTLKKAMKAKLPDNDELAENELAENELAENEPVENEPDSESDVEFEYEIKPETEPTVKIEAEEIAMEVPKFTLVADSDDDEDETDDDEGYLNEDEEYRMWTEFESRAGSTVY